MIQLEEGIGSVKTLAKSLKLLDVHQRI